MEILLSFLVSKVGKVIKRYALKPKPEDHSFCIEATR